MNRFDHVLVLDWSANSTPKRGADSIWIGSAGKARTIPANYATRHEAIAALCSRLDAALAAGERVLVAFDIGFGYPRGFATRLTGKADALAVWDWLAARITDDARNRNNRFEVAAEINRHFPGLGPFWGRPSGRDLPDLPDKGSLRHGVGLAELRLTETLCSGAHPMWKLYTTGSVGSQSLLGQAHLARLRKAYGAQLSVWPMQSADAPVVLAETYLSLLNPAIRAIEQTYSCRDAAQVDLLARALCNIDLATLLAHPAPPDILREEGWILGAGAESALLAALDAPDPVSLQPRNDGSACGKG